MPYRIPWYCSRGFIVCDDPLEIADPFVLKGIFTTEEDGDPIMMRIDSRSRGIRF